MRLQVNYADELVLRPVPLDLFLRVYNLNAPKDSPQKFKDKLLRHIRKKKRDSFAWTIVAGDFGAIV